MVHNLATIKTWQFYGFENIAAFNSWKKKRQTKKNARKLRRITRFMLIGID